MEDDKAALPRFTRGNAKLSDDVLKFGLPAGYTCPGALACLARADADTGKLVDGPNQTMRCFAASMEAMSTEKRKLCWHNHRVLWPHRGDPAMMASLLSRGLRAELADGEAGKVRVHDHGDFFNQAYFDAWLLVASRRPEVLFYAYTKSLLFWAERLVDIPVNLRLTASRGGRFDHIAQRLSLPEAVVVNHPEEAKKGGWEIDHDDSHPMAERRETFALLLHGQQPSGSVASAAQRRMRDEGIQYGYSRKGKNER